MPSKTTAKNAGIATKSAAQSNISKELLEQFVQGPMRAEAIQDASMAFKKALIEHALGGELSHHLGYPPAMRSRPRPTTTATAAPARRY